MPRYKFKWVNLPPSLLRALCRDLDLYVDDEGNAAALQRAYGARPDEDFIRETWPTLLESWLRTQTDSRERVVEELRSRRRESGSLHGRGAQMDYLRRLNNSRNLRDVAWTELVAVGEVDDSEDNALATLLAPFTNRVIYPGKGTRMSAEETDLELIVGGTALRGWEVNPGQRHALVYYGGNDEGLDELGEELSSKFPDHTSYLVAYRGYGASEGKPSERALTTDALAVLKLAAARHRGSVDVVGRSLGSAVAMQVAARRRVRRLVLITPFDSVAALAAEYYPWLPVRRMLRDRWDSAAVAHNIRAPLLVVRAGLDEVVSPSSTDRLLAALPAEPQVLNLSRCDHISVVDSPACWRAIVKFLAP